MSTTCPVFPSNEPSEETNSRKRKDYEEEEEEESDDDIKINPLTAEIEFYHDCEIADIAQDLFLTIWDFELQEELRKVIEDENVVLRQRLEYYDLQGITIEDALNLREHREMAVLKRQCKAFCLRDLAILNGACGRSLNLEHAKETMRAEFLKTTERRSQYYLRHCPNIYSLRLNFPDIFM